MTWPEAFATVGSVVAVAGLFAFMVWCGSREDES